MWEKRCWSTSILCRCYGDLPATVLGTMAGARCRVTRSFPIVTKTPRAAATTGHKRVEDGVDLAVWSSSRMLALVSPSRELCEMTTGEWPTTAGRRVTLLGSAALSARA
jgi:hypothetical protein